MSSLGHGSRSVNHRRSERASSRCRRMQCGRCRLSRSTLIHHRNAAEGLAGAEAEFETCSALLVELRPWRARKCTLARFDTAAACGRHGCESRCSRLRIEHRRLQRRKHLIRTRLALHSLLTALGRLATARRFLLTAGATGTTLCAVLRLEAVGSDLLLQGARRRQG